LFLILNHISTKHGSFSVASVLNVCVHVMNQKPEMISMKHLGIGVSKLSQALV